jgi:hypothetical protein
MERWANFVATACFNSMALGASCLEKARTLFGVAYL